MTAQIREKLQMDPAGNVHFDSHEEVVFCEDTSSGLSAVIAIHSTLRGAAMGGCRWKHYEDAEAALSDGLRLSRGMTLKNAMAELPAGGGKAVVFRAGADRGAALEAFGQAVERLKGRYVTAEDVGTSVADMTAVGRRTRHVAGREALQGRAGGDPSRWTALGVFLALSSALEPPLKRSRIAVQGLGSVGFELARLLHEQGARLVVADIDRGRAMAAQDAFGADVEAVDRIHLAAADAFSPCALGAVLNAGTICDLAAPLVCGAANNQLQEDADGTLLMQRGILYCPDYLVNAGGIINVAAEYFGEPEAAVVSRLNKIPDRLAHVLGRAGRERRPTNLVADEIALEKVCRPVAFPDRVAVNG